MAKTAHGHGAHPTGTGIPAPQLGTATTAPRQAATGVRARSVAAEAPAVGRPASPPKPKKPRVSFASVSTRTFASGCEDPKKLSSPQERQLSPLLDASILSDDGPAGAAIVYNEDDDTGHVRFPGINDLALGAMTPDGASKAKRSSMSGELGDMQRQITHAFGPSPGSTSSLPRAAGGVGRFSGPTPPAAMSGGRSRAEAAAPPSSVAAPSLEEILIGDTIAEGAASTSLPKQGPALGAGGASGTQVVPAAGAAPPVTPVRHKAEDEEGADATFGESDASGEITANIQNLAYLAMQDELEGVPPAKAPRGASPPAPSPITAPGRVAQARGTTPSRSPTVASEASPLDDGFDLFAQYKKNQQQPGALGAAGAPVAQPIVSPIFVDGSIADLAFGSGQPAPLHGVGLGRNQLPASPALPVPLANGFTGLQPPTLRSRSGSPDSVDMASFNRTVLLGGRDSELDVESEVPEARKSFATRVPLHDSRLGSVPTPTRANAAERRSASKSSSPVPIMPPPVMKSQLPSPPPLPRAAGACGRPLETRAAASKHLFPVPLHDAGAQGASFIPGPGGRRNGSRSSCEDSGARSMSPDSAPLPGASTLQAIPGQGMGLLWKDFLSHCNITFPAMDVGQATGTSAPVSAPLGAADPLMRKRGACLQVAASQLSDKNAATQQEYNDALQRWDLSETAPSSAVSLLQALNAPHELEAFRGRAKAWQAYCKDEAWLEWYAAKDGWLKEERRVVQEHTKDLKHELFSLNEAGRHIEQISRTVKSSLNQKGHKSGLGSTAKSFRDLAGESLRTHQQDCQLMRLKAPEAQAMLDEERQRVAELEKRVERARRAAERDQEEARQAHRSLLLQKARQVALQKQRFVRTCCVSGATATTVALKLRGGAQFVLTKAAAGAVDLVRVAFETAPTAAPKTSGTDVAQLLGLDRELFEHAWYRLLVAAKKQAAVAVAPPALLGSGAARFESTLPCGEVPSLLRRLDYAAVRIMDQLKALRALPQECSEVVQVAAKLCGGSPTALAITVTVLVVRSHAFVGHPAVLVPLKAAGSPTDASKVCLEFTADLTTFPEVFAWSELAVREVFGRGDAAAIERALREQGGREGNHSSSLAGAVALAAHVLHA